MLKVSNDSMGCIKSLLLVVAILLGAQAYSANSRQANLVYDLGFSSGTYNSNSYSEIHAGINWRLLEHIVWRNTAFIRLFDTSSSAGVDTSMRYTFDSELEKGGFGLGTFAGPGYRFSKKELSGPFIEGGVMVKGSGFGAGVGAKSILYNSPTKYANGDEAPKNDTVVFIILAVGGGI